MTYKMRHWQQPITMIQLSLGKSRARKNVFVCKQNWQNNEESKRIGIHCQFLLEWSTFFYTLSWYQISRKRRHVITVIKINQIKNLRTTEPPEFDKGKKNDDDNDNVDTVVIMTWA